MSHPGGVSIEVLLIGGRSGVGKSSVAYETSDQLRLAGVAHTLVDGDNLGAVFPKPADDPEGTALTEASLAALWANFAAVGQHRLIYVNTVSVLELEMITRAMGGVDRAVGVLLTATTETTYARLAGREIGSELAAHARRSARKAAALESEAGSWVTRIATDGRRVSDIAADVVRATGWTAPAGH